MTNGQKIEWLSNATNEQLIKQFATTVRRTNCGNFEQELDAYDDYALVEAELMKRLNK